MVLDSKFSAVREAYGIVDPEDWQRISPAEVLALPGVGERTLDLIRVFLAGRNLTLRDDQTAEYWKQNLATSQIGNTMGTRDVARACGFTIVIDSAEQLPWDFRAITRDKKPLLIPLVTQKLFFAESKTTPKQSFDYSILGFETRFCLERKSHEDLYGTLGRDHDDFESKLALMNNFDVAGVVVETDYDTATGTAPQHSSLNPASVEGSIIAWAQRYPRVHWWFAPTRFIAQRLAFKLMNRFWVDWTEACAL